MICCYVCVPSGCVLDSELCRWQWAVLAFDLDCDLLQCWRAVLGRVLDSDLCFWRWAVLAFNLYLDVL